MPKPGGTGGAGRWARPLVMAIAARIVPAFTAHGFLVIWQPDWLGFAEKQSLLIVQALIDQ